MTLPMNWDEWAQHDGVALAARVRKGELKATELAEQAAAAVARVDHAVSGVVELFDDAIADPAGNGTHLNGPFAGLPFLMKDLGPTMKGRLQEMGSLLMRGNRAAPDTFRTGKMRQAGLNLIGLHHDAGIRRAVRRTIRPSMSPAIPGTRTTPPAAHRPAVQPWWRRVRCRSRMRPTAAARSASRRRQRQHRTEGFARRLLDRASPLRPVRAGLDPGLSVALGARHRRVRRCLPRRRVRRVHAVLDAGAALHGGDQARPRPAAHRVSHQWGDYRATAPIAAELERVGKFLESLGHHVDHALPDIDYRAAFEAQTLCYISNFAVVIGNLLAARGLERPPADLVEPVNIRIWEHGRHTSFAERARMQAVFNTTSRGFGAFFDEWDIILTPVTALPTPKVGTREFLTISDNPDVLDWFGNLWRNFAFTPLANLCGIPAISLPLATHEHGLPLGRQAIAKQANDGLLLQLAAQTERAIDGKWNGGKKPGVHVTQG